MQTSKMQKQIRRSKSLKCRLLILDCIETKLHDKRIQFPKVKKQIRRSKSLKCQLLILDCKETIAKEKNPNVENSETNMKVVIAELLIVDTKL